MYTSDGGIHEQRKLLDLQAAGNIDYKVFPQLKPQPPLDESAWTTVVPYPILKLISLEKIYNYGMLVPMLVVKPLKLRKQNQQNLEQ